MNGEVCCILGICCPPEARAAALAGEMVKDGVYASENRQDKLHHATKVAEYIFTHFDLVPAGTGVPLMKAAGQVARKAADK